MAPVPGRSPLNLDDLRYLLAIGRAGRMITAGALLGVEHTTVKRRIERLEQALGARLVERGADGWELTAVGREVMARAESLEAIAGAVVSAASGDDGITGTVRVVAPEGFALAFATPALARVRREHPGIAVELVASTRPLTTRASGFDLAVTVGSPGAVRLRSELLSPYLLRLYASRDYLAQHPPIHSLADLERHSLVFYVDALLTVRELDLAPLLGGMPIGFGATNVTAQLEATRLGAGIGLLHAFIAESDPDLVPVLPTEVRFTLQFSLSMRREVQHLPAVAAVRDALHAEVASRAGELLPDD